MEPTDAAASASGAGRGFSPVRRLATRRVLLGVLVILALGWVLWARCGIRGCPPVERLAAYRPDGAPVLLDRNGAAFARLAPVERRMVRLDSLPAYVPAAFIAVEDRRFFEHRGIDWVRVGGAALANLRAGRTVQGSSTITMQLARNVFSERLPARERTWRRKLLEARVARRIEARFGKPEILELYLNHIYFGNGAYGVEAAARHYFDRPASRLTVEQAALLAALPKAPATYDPRRHPQRARARRDLVLGLMERHGVIEAGAAQEARDRAIRVVRATDARRTSAPNAPWFVQRVREQLEDRFGEDLWTRRLVVRTTLDPAAQQALEQEMEAQIRRVESGAFGRFSGPRRTSGSTDYLQGAAVALDVSTGEVRALVGGRDWVESRFNRALDARRQVGSAFKPFVFATALSEGWSRGDWLDDSPYRMAARGARPWEPSNFDGRFFGPVTLHEAIVLSRNVPTVRLAEAVGVEDVTRVARAAGLSGAMPETPVIALGVTEASPLELAAAYGVFANEGTTLSPRWIGRVENADGEVVWEPDAPRGRRVLDARVARAMTDLLRDAVDHGTGRAVRTAGYRGPAAGKTGTTNDGADAWFVGYTPSLLTAVWVGFDTPRAIAPRVSGGTVAAEIWGRAMRRVERGVGAWPERFAWSEDDAARRDDTDDGDRSRRDDRRGDFDSWLDALERDLERGRRRAERERNGSLRELTEGLRSLVDRLPVERDARRELRRMLDELGREIERAERERLRAREDALRDWLDDAADALEDADVPRGARSRIERELREQLRRESVDYDDLESLMGEQLLRILPQLLSTGGRDIRIEAGR